MRNSTSTVTDSFSLSTSSGKKGAFFWLKKLYRKKSPKIIESDRNTFDLTRDLSLDTYTPSSIRFSTDSYKPRNNRSSIDSCISFSSLFKYSSKLQDIEDFEEYVVPPVITSMHGEANASENRKTKNEFNEAKMKLKEVSFEQALKSGFKTENEDTTLRFTLTPSLAQI